MNKTILSALNDIFIVLLMIFMAPQLTPPTDIEIDANKNNEKNTTLHEEGEDIPRLYISVSANGILELDHHTVQIDDIKQAAQQQAISTIRLNIDEHTPYRVILRLSQSLSAMGYKLEMS